LSEIDIFVTDELTSRPLRDMCRDQSVELIEVGGASEAP
jgi:hypothetical protein